MVLTYLRDEAIQNASTLADILPGHNSDLSKSVASQLQATDGANVLFIFDGWDEFPHALHHLSLHCKDLLLAPNPQPLLCKLLTAF